jgi:peptide deformylase
MAILEILKFPDPRLRNRAKPVEKVDDALRQLADDMLETMYQAPGIGLAATQVGVAKQLIVVDVSEEKNQPLVLVNPEVVAWEGEEEMEEGCLSVPGFYEKVKRAEKVTVRALDLQGEPVEMDLDGLLSVCVQHEIDHLHGKLFVDHISRLKRERIRKKLEKEARAAAAQQKKAARRAL